TGRAGTARRPGPGKRDEKVQPAGEPVPKLRKRRAGSNLVDTGRSAAHARRRRATPTPGEVAGQEATVKVCGVAVATLPEQQLGVSLVHRSQCERGNRPESPD